MLVFAGVREHRHLILATVDLLLTVRIAWHGYTSFIATLAKEYASPGCGVATLLVTLVQHVVAVDAAAESGNRSARFRMAGA